MTAPPRREVTLIAAAKADIERLHADDPAIARLALRTLKALEAGDIIGQPLSDMAKTGDLGDCRKLYFGAGQPPSHRIVYRSVDGDPTRIEVVEVIVVEARADLYAYLLAASRLGRLRVESKKGFNRLHQDVIARRASKKARGTTGPGSARS